MKTELDALRLIIAKEHSFPEHLKYQKPVHENMVPLLIFIQGYQNENGVPAEARREERLAMMGFICETIFSSFYEMTEWQIRSITNFVSDLEEEEHGKGRRFLEYVASES